MTYVWGSYFLTLLAIAVEVLAVLRRRRRAKI
jgi:heme exporter protein CcmD